MLHYVALLVMGRIGSTQQTRGLCGPVVAVTLWHMPKLVCICVIVYICRLL